MSKEKIVQFLFVVPFFGFAAYIFYLTVFPEKVFVPGRNYPSVELILSQEPVHYYSGLDNPDYYRFESSNYRNEFRISGYVLDLVQDNDSVSIAINRLKAGDTVSIMMDSTSLLRLKDGNGTIEILGLGVKQSLLFNPAEIEKYQRKGKWDNRFGVLVALVILSVIIWKNKKSKRTDEVIN